MRKCRIAGMKRRHFILGAVSKQNRRGVIVILILHNILPFKLKQSSNQFKRVHLSRVRGINKHQKYFQRLTKLRPM